jgi:amidase
MRMAIPAAALAFLSASSLASPPVRADGQWLMTVDYMGTPLVWKLNLTQAAGQISGDLEGDKLVGAITRSGLHFVAKDDQGGFEDADAHIADGRMSGDMIFVDSAEPSHTKHKLTFTAIHASPPPVGPPRRHEFTPTTFYRQFSPFNPPALHINPGDTIHTTTVDALGVDGNGVRWAAGGNPQTGPFYVESAMPGDTLVVHIEKLRLNRDYAMSTNALVNRGLDSAMAVRMNGLGQKVKWHLDLARGIARPETPGEHMAGYTVPVRPMLGCVAVAPRSRQAPPGTGDSGDYGGNIDFNELGEGATVYLPVNNPGALLYFGDAHAVQGDGETTGDALETSMDVEVKVDLIRGGHLNQVRVETPTHLAAIGLQGSLDTAFQSATADMGRWLANDYKLTPAEIAELLGTAAEYKVTEVADRNAGIVLEISKERLAMLKHDPLR